jgi:hypothetical protein
VGESNASPFKLRDSKSDVCAAEVDASLRTKFQPVVYFVEQETHSGAIEERQITGAIKLLQTDQLFIECFRAINIDYW